MSSFTFKTDRERYQKREGLEGPFFYLNGMVLYYDAKEGQYWDPTSDFYLSSEEYGKVMTHEEIAREKLYRQNR